MGAALIVSAAADGDAAMVGMLLSQGARVDVRDKGFTPLLAAAQRGHKEVCELLLASGSDIEEKHPGILDNALQFTAARGHQSLLELLLSHKADVNSRNRLGFTPLHTASQGGHLASVLALLQAGADPLLPAVDFALPIHTAAALNHIEVVRILIEQGSCRIDQV